VITSPFRIPLLVNSDYISSVLRLPGQYRLLGTALSTQATCTCRLQLSFCVTSSRHAAGRLVAACVRYADLNGQNRHVLSVSTAYLSHPYGISVFENSVYWTDWNYKSLNRADKWLGGNEFALLTNLPVQPYDVKVVHPLRDREGESLIHVNCFCLSELFLARLV
jgi:hypothetical protein